MYNIEKFSTNVEEDYIRRKETVISDYNKYVKNSNNNAITELFDLFWQTDRAIIFTIFNKVLFISHPKIHPRNELEMMEGFIFLVADKIEKNEAFNAINLRMNSETGMYTITELNTPDTYTCLIPVYDGDTDKGYKSFVTAEDYVNLIKEEVGKNNARMKIAETYYPEIGEEIVPDVNESIDYYN